MLILLDHNMVTFVWTSRIDECVSVREACKCMRNWFQLMISTMWIMAKLIFSKFVVDPKNGLKYNIIHVLQCFFVFLTNVGVILSFLFRYDWNIYNGDFKVSNNKQSTKICWYFCFQHHSSVYTLQEPSCWGKSP